MKLHPFLFLAIPLVLFLNLLLSTYTIPPILANANQNASEIFCQECSRELRIGVSDSVGIEVTRHRWYGTIYESNSDKTLKTLGLSIPLEANGKSLKLLHLSIIILCLFLFVAGILVYKKESVVVLR